MSTDLQLYKELDGKLVALLESLGFLVKACRIPEDDEEGSRFRDKRPVGDLLEVLAEKLLFAGHECLNLIAQLKKGAVISDVAALMDNVRTVRDIYAKELQDADTRLALIKSDAQALLSSLEKHYYSSKHRRPPQIQPLSQDLQQLCQLAMESPPP